MELKVWVEGIQRIVCGVNDKTTCQDVVFALAHATGKTGRFTLIERWRNSERLLAPNELPLKVLLKWGEHSNDVQFILQWAPLDSGTTKTTATNNLKPTLPSETSANLSKINHNPGNMAVVSPTSSSGISTRQMSHSSSSPLAFTESEELIPNTIGKTTIDNMSVDRILSKRKEGNTNSDFMRSSGFISHRDIVMQTSSSEKDSGRTSGISEVDPQIQSQNNKKSGEVNLPPPYRAPPTPNKGTIKPPLPPYREPPAPPSNQSNRPVLPKVNGNSSSSLVLNTSPGNTSTSGTSSTIGTPNNSELSNTATTTAVGLNTNTAESNGIMNGQAESVISGVSKDIRTLLQQHLIQSTANTHRSSQNQALSREITEIVESRIGLSSRPSDSPPHGLSSSNSSSLTSTSTNSPLQSSSQYRELIKVINSQREKLSSQQAELTKHDAEIMFWEGRAKEQQRHMDLINKEIARLELLSVQHESQVLSLAHLEEENNMLTSESEALTGEIGKLKSELETYDNELLHCQNKIRFLTDELQSMQTVLNAQQEEQLQREACTVAEIELLKTELEAARRETEAVSDLSGSLEREVSSLEFSLIDKKKKMEILVTAMKEANLQSLTIQPSADELIEGSHFKSGIQRRIIGSPRQLEYSAPTSKNPHGVWV